MFIFSELKSPSVHCIREIYESDNAHNHFISELDRGLYEETEYIIIEPTKLGDETARWIKAGNCLHKTAVFSGLATIASSNYLNLFFLKSYILMFLNEF